MKDRWFWSPFRVAAFTLLALLVLSGCGKQKAMDVTSIDEPVAEERALVNEHISDPETRDKVLALIDEDEARMRAFFKVRDAHQEKIQDLNARYDVSRAELEAELQKYDEELRQVVLQMLESRSRLRALVSEEQWDKITSGKAGYLDN